MKWAFLFLWILLSCGFSFAGNCGLAVKKVAVQHVGYAQNFAVKSYVAPVYHQQLYQVGYGLQQEALIRSAIRKELKAQQAHDIYEEFQKFLKFKESNGEVWDSTATGASGGTLVGQHCGKCHSADKAQGGFALSMMESADGREAAIKAIMNPDESARMPKGSPIDDATRGALVQEILGLK